MNNRLVVYLIVFLVTGLIVLSLNAQMEKEDSSDESSKLLSEFLGQTHFMEGRMLQLAEAIPAEKYSWRPAEGVRSVGEVLQHVAEANNGFSKMAGLETAEEEKSMKTETASTDKEQVMADLKQSFESLRTALTSLDNQTLDKQIHVFGMDTSVRNFVIMTLNHQHEHQGQLIAYARMNGVVPPWSVGQ